MKKINISYKNNIFKVKIEKEKAFPNDLFKIEFESSELLQIIKSPVWIEEKGNVYSFAHIDYDSCEKSDLLKSIAVGIDEYYFKEN